MHLLLALDHGFESLAAVSLTSYLLHQRFESVVLVTPAGQRMQMHLDHIGVGFANAVADVSEVYSPPRITDMAQRMGLKAGWALDLTTNDEDGHAWDFNDAKMRNKATRKVLRDRPLVLVGSPPCTDWSQLMNLNWDRMSEEDRERRMKEELVDR